ncbi:MAG: glycosyltransferase [Holosporaceae bacterium]|jgi:glycosyltransferase involved in cell wall biosynthesis|nr:glycosyltransferase [Holosporaceae bacterium]
MVPRFATGVLAIMNEYPLISVVIPTYNRVKFLPKAIDSILKQDYPNIEIIIVDDGSSDGTAELIANGNYGTQVKYFYQENRGVAASRNLGIEKATGKWIAFLDSDDSYVPGKLMAQAKYFHEHPECEIVFTRYKNFLTDDKLKNLEQTQNELEREVWEQYYLASAIVKGEAFEKCGGFMNEFGIGEDTELLFRMQTIGICLNHCLKEDYYNRCIHGENTILRYNTKDVFVLYRENDAPYDFVFENLRRIVGERYAQRQSLISVIIPARNASKYIRDAILSVKGQSIGENVEIIVVDDGSTDDTAAIASAAGCQVIQIPPSGAPAARNIGLEHATGDFIMFHDADDLLEKNALAFLYNELYKYPELQAIFSMRINFISPDIMPEERQKIFRKAPLHTNKQQPYELFGAGLFGALAGCALMRRALFDQIGNFDENFQAGDAILWQLHLKEQNIKTAKLPIITCFRRIHSSNFSITHKNLAYKYYAAIIRQHLKLKKAS